jgi:hypothetical protein
MAARDHDTAEVELPAEEPFGAPATVYRVEPRLFGFASTHLLGALAALALLLGIVFFATGHWALGSLFVVFAVVLAALCAVLASRDPRSPLGRVVIATGATARDCARLAGVSLSAWSGAGRDVVRLHRERWLLQAELRRRLTQLGEAVHRGEDERAEALRADTRALEQELDRRAAELAAALGLAHRRVEGERMSSQRTVIRTPGQR